MNCQTEILSGKLFATQKLIQQYKVKAINFKIKTRHNNIQRTRRKFYNIRDEKSRSSPTALNG